MAHQGRARLGDFPCRATAVDLGSATVRMHVNGRGVVASEPSAIARSASNGRLLAAGTAALDLAGERGVKLIRPIRNGVPAEAADTESLLRSLMRSCHRWHYKAYMAKPRMAVTVPSGITQVQLGAVRAAAYGAGARGLTIVATPLAAAAGVGLPKNPEDVVVVADIGAQVTDVGVIIGTELLGSRTALVGGITLDEAIMAQARWEYGLVLAPSTAESVKLRIGAAMPGRDGVALVHGKDKYSELPCTAVLTSADVREAIGPPLAAIVEAVRAGIAVAPPELAAAICASGITLTGGSAALPGLDELISKETGLPVRVAPNTLNAAVTGAASFLQRCRDMDDEHTSLWAAAAG
ncbi:rod shape-determining protein [Actinomadura sp. SCN-SB]|uniref:rod shape-determining protein n=1 Tax=Actinomadura sp. SCN-SB TaxID=3373092 RepID=UPI003751A749